MPETLKDKQLYTLDLGALGALLGCWPPTTRRTRSAWPEIAVFLRLGVTSTNRVIKLTGKNLRGHKRRTA